MKKILSGLFKKRSHLGVVSFNMKPVSGPWGGSSVFVSQLSSFLKSRGYSVRYDLSKDVDVIILIDPRPENMTFGVKEIREYKRRNPDVITLHRINECDKRKNTQFMDKLLADASEIADYTVFISAWLCDYHAERWFDTARPHSSVYNGADPRIFHPVKSLKATDSKQFRIVTHHWSNNRMKGFDFYKQVDDLLANGELNGIELWVIGRWPENIKWRSAKTFPATFGSDLAEKLRSCDAYITASLWEPCGMHHVEGVQCGLPLIYHEDGGGIVEVGLKCGIGFTDNVKETILKMREDYALYRDRLLRNIPSGDRMCIEYAEIIQRLLAVRYN